MLQESVYLMGWCTRMGLHSQLLMAATLGMPTTHCVYIQLNIYGFFYLASAETVWLDVQRFFAHQVCT